MHKVGNRVYASVEEIMTMKTDERLLGRFLTLTSDWVNAKAFIYSRKTRGELSEWKAWLSSGLWTAIRICDDRLQGVGGIFDLAWRDGMKAYKGKYGNNAQKTEDACDSCHRDGEGGFEDIEIPSVDENIASLDYTDFMEKLRTKVPARDYNIILRRLNGQNLRKISVALGLSHEGVRKIMDKNLRHLLEYA